MKFNYARIFLPGFGFFGVSVILSIYNAFALLFLAGRFEAEPAVIGFFMTLAAPAFMLLAFALMVGVRRGEAVLAQTGAMG